MQSNSKVETILNRAKKSEKQYDWLDAKNLYEKVLSISISLKDDSIEVPIAERIGYCYFRAALQAENREQFDNRMKLSNEAYKHMEHILRPKIDEPKLIHARAMVALTSSWVEQDFSKMEALLDDWWNLENLALGMFEEKQDKHAIGKICNNLLEYSSDTRLFFSHSEFQKRRKELIDIGEKAIAALVETNEKYELARAYCWTALYYGIGSGVTTHNKKKNPSQVKWLNYSKKALSLAREIGDDWLIGWSYNANSNVAPGRYTKDFASSMHDAMKVIECGQKAKDNMLMLTGKWNIGQLINYAIELEENSEKNRENLTLAIKLTGEAVEQAKIINAPIGILLAQLCYTISLLSLSSLTTDFREKKRLIEEAVKIGREGVEYTKGTVWLHTVYPMDALSRALLLLAKIERNNKERRKNLEESLMIREKARKIMRTFRASLIASNPQEYNVPPPQFVWGAYQLLLIKSEIAEIEEEPDQKVALFDEATKLWEKCLELVEKMAGVFPATSEWVGGNGLIYQKYADVLTQLYTLKGNKLTITKANELYNRAIQNFRNFDLSNHVAETYWKIAINYNTLGQYLEASHNYALASEAYQATSRKIPPLEELSNDYSLYMNAWNQIEQARHFHSIADYEEARQHYEKAAKFHQSTSSWNYLASNYFAWSYIEEAENLSRKEEIKKAKQIFQKALEQFYGAEECLKHKLEEITSPEENEMIQSLLKASDLRREYCKTRILMEEARFLDREGKYLESSRKYGEAAQKLFTILDKTDIEAEKKELEYIAILCQAWEKMANAEEISSSDVYLESASLFEKAKDYCYTKKASLWALGNSSFCKGLAAGLNYKNNMDLEDNALAKQYIRDAASNYSKAGFKNASKYAMATQRLFDAYIFMNQAEREVDPEKRAKQYQMAENLLQIAASSFMKAKQPEKTAQVQEILGNVREEKALAVSLSQVMHAPTIASSTLSFTAPSPTSEASIGLENFEHANVQANIIPNVKQVKIGESFCLSVEFVNAGREPALLMRVEDFVPSDFIVVKKPEIYRIEDNTLNMKGKQIAPLKLVEAKLVLQPSKKGRYQLSPRVHYLDERGQNKTLELKTLEINVEEVILEDRVSTGTEELDSLLLGGVPKEYAVVLAGSPCDEREMIVKNFLNAGTKKDETTFFISTEATAGEELLENPNFFLFLCNPKPKNKVPDLPNVYRLQGKADITNLGIALTKAYRNIDQSVANKRVCVEILSDVLVKHGVNTTREWISGLITDLGAKGFTILAVMDPKEHPLDQATTVLNLFDGEISILQSDDPLDCKKSLLVKKLRNQDYIKNPICLR